MAIKSPIFLSALTGRAIRTKKNAHGGCLCRTIDVWLESTAEACYSKSICSCNYSRFTQVDAKCHLHCGYDFHERTHEEDILARFSTRFRKFLNNNGRQGILSLHKIAFDWCLAANKCTMCCERHKRVPSSLPSKSCEMSSFPSLTSSSFSGPKKVTNAYKKVEFAMLGVDGFDFPSLILVLLYKYVQEQITFKLSAPNCTGLAELPKWLAASVLKEGVFYIFYMTYFCTRKNM